MISGPLRTSIFIATSVVTALASSYEAVKVMSGWFLALTAPLAFFVTAVGCYLVAAVYDGRA